MGETRGSRGGRSRLSASPSSEQQEGATGRAGFWIPAACEPFSPKGAPQEPRSQSAIGKRFSITFFLPERVCPVEPRLDPEFGSLNMINSTKKVDIMLGLCYDKDRFSTSGRQTLGRRTWMKESQLKCSGSFFFKAHTLRQICSVGIQERDRSCTKN